MASKGKVLVAMSGGVDSSVAAALLVRDGYEVVGCFMRLGSPGETLDEIVPYEQAACPTPSAGGKTIKIGHQGCCSINDAADARLVASELGVPFYVCNFKKDFGRIIDYFVDEYTQGRTPNPCVRCNDWLKFGKLHEYAKQIGADFVASGHYARVRRGSDGSVRLLRGVDLDKDQSYVLFGAARERLADMMLPIGELEKPKVRELAKEFGLPVFDKPDSQEICFVPDNDYAGLVERRRPEAAKAGRIVDEQGKQVGEHQGQHRFTIGQRRGLDLSLGYRVYVVGKDVAANTVTVGSKEQLNSAGCIAGEANWLVEPSRAGEWFEVLAKFRYNSDPVAARARVLETAPKETVTHSGRLGRFEVEFEEPQQAVAAGQAVVLFDRGEPEVVLGGGWIERARAQKLRHPTAQTFHCDVGWRRGKLLCVRVNPVLGRADAQARGDPAARSLNMICAKWLAVAAGIVLTQNNPGFGPEETGAGLLALASTAEPEKSGGPTANGSKAIEKDQPATTTTTATTNKSTKSAGESTRTGEKSESKGNVDGDEALKLLQEGNERWVSDKPQNPNDEPTRRATLAEQGQKPVATIITCADSRLPVERIFDRGVGELFVVRVAGNVAGDSETGTIEYGVEHLHTPLLVVMGHTKCGAVAAATGDKLPGGALGRLVSHISPAVDRARKGNPGTDSKDIAAFAVRENVWQTVFDLLKGSDEVRTAVKNGQLRVVGAVCDISTGKVSWMGEHPWQTEIVAALDTKPSGETQAHADDSH